jgi:hypothetical protein
MVCRDSNIDQVAVESWEACVVGVVGFVRTPKTPTQTKHLSPSHFFKTTQHIYMPLFNVRKVKLL